MSLADDLLDTARRLAAAPTATEADLRRAVSTAYYSLFHRLIEEAAAALLTDRAQQQSLGRQFAHTEMKKACQFVTKKPLPAAAAVFFGPAAPFELEEVATAFIVLQQKRHAADYDVSRSPTVAEAVDAVRAVEVAFTQWSLVRSTPAAKPFLLLLLTGEPKGR